LSYINNLGVATNINLDVVVKGIVMKYSPSGNVKTGNDVVDLTGNITISLPSNQTSLDITQYLSFTLANGSAYATEKVKVVVVDENGQELTNLTNLMSGQTYTYYIAYSRAVDNGPYELVGLTGYTFTINVASSN